MSTSVLLSSLPRSTRNASSFKRIQGRILSSCLVEENFQYYDNEYDVTPQDERRFSGLMQTPKDLIGCYYLYDDWGSSNYDDACQDSYYLYRAEKDLLKVNAHKIAEMCNDTTSWIDFGCGTGHKILPVLNAFGQKKLTYYPVDISRDFLDIVRGNISAHAQNVDVVPLAASYNEAETFQALQSISPAPRMVSIFGGELMCMERQKLDLLLRRINGIMSPDDVFLVGYDPRKRDASVHVDSYDYELSHQWFKNILNNLGSFLEHEFNRDDFDYVPMFESNTPALEPYYGGVVHYLRCNKDLVVDSRFGEVNFRRGEMMYMLHSAKPTPGELRELMVNYGFAKTAEFTCSGNLMGVSAYRKLVHQDKELY